MVAPATRRIHVLATALVTMALLPSAFGGPVEQDPVGPWVPTLEELRQLVYAAYTAEDSPAAVCQAPSQVFPPPPDGGEEVAINSKLCAGFRLPAIDGPSSAPGAQRPRSGREPVLLIHGAHAGGMGSWNDMRNKMLGTGLFDRVDRIGYYGCHKDMEADVAVAGDRYGAHEKWFGGAGEHAAPGATCGDGATRWHDKDTDVRHLAFHLAWYIYREHTEKGEAVDIIGHSLGGILARYAITMVNIDRNDPEDLGWPPELLVEDYVSLGSPQSGAYCPWLVYPFLDSDIRQLCSQNDFMKWLRNHKEIQSQMVTDASLVGSFCDGIVAVGAGVGILSEHRVVAQHRYGYVGGGGACPGHDDYYREPHISLENNARFRFQVDPDEWNIIKWPIQDPGAPSGRLAWMAAVDPRI